MLDLGTGRTLYTEKLAYLQRRTPHLRELRYQPFDVAFGHHQRTVSAMIA